MRTPSVRLPVIVIRHTALRAAPGRDATPLRALPVGHRAVITGGPVIKKGQTWWELDNAGWCAERVDTHDILHVIAINKWN